MISGPFHTLQATARMRPCKVFRPNRAKTFHVKRIGTISPWNRTNFPNLSAKAVAPQASPCYERPTYLELSRQILSFVDPRADAVIAHLTRAGYARVEPPILQPASIFFDSGEDLRAQLYLTSDLSGADYCLRPEYTNSRFGRLSRRTVCGTARRLLLLRAGVPVSPRQDKRIDASGC